MERESGSLVDKLYRPLKDLRISVTDRCNFRCNFCMPAGEPVEFYPRNEILSFEEILKVVKACMELGVKKVKITGGEPLLRRDVHKLIGMIKNIGMDNITLTTNGFLLRERTHKLKESGLKRVTVSVHSLRDDVFSKIVGKRVYVKDILAGIDAAIDVGLTPVKVNVCVIKGVNDLEILDIAKFFKEKGCVVRFIEFMDVGTLNGWSLDRVVSYDDILSILSKSFKFKPLGKDYTETSFKFTYEDDGLEFHVIPSVTRPFCTDCSRLRLTADGHLYTCLFASYGWNVKELIRKRASTEDIKNFIINVWAQRQDKYSQERLEKLDLKSKKVEMFKLGG